jgi:hypothetical protein
MERERMALACVRTYSTPVLVDDTLQLWPQRMSALRLSLSGH